MTRDNTAAAPTDADLVAYLDGELSPAESVRIGQRVAADAHLAARVEHLMRGGRPFREAFDSVLAEAPVDRLDAALTAVLARPAPPVSMRSWVRRWTAMAAAAVGLIAAGAGLDRLVVTRPGSTVASSAETEGSEDWRRAVAQYLSLYTPDTLAALPEGGGFAPQRLAGIGGRLGLNLTAARLDLPDLTLKRADLYDYDGRPLAFLAYLAPQAGPVALCITETQGGSDAQRTEIRRGMNVVYWSQGRHSFMLIGRAATAQLQALATTVAARFAPRSDPPG